MSRVPRLDGWTNLVTGLGDAVRDKRLAAQPMGDFLRQHQAELLWRADDMAARAVETPPQDALRRGFKFVVEGEADGEDEDDVDSDQTLESIDGKTASEWVNQLPGPMAEQRPLGPGTMGGKPGRYDLANVTDPTLAVASQDETADSSKLQKRVNKRLKRLGAKQAVLKAMQFERAYGGAAIFLGTIDRSPGRSANVLSRPLDLKYLAELRFLTVLTPMELVPFRYYGDPLAPKYGQVSHWTMVPKSKGINPRPSIIRVHESRLIIFGGIRTSRFMLEMHRGFGDSILNRLVGHIRNFSTAYDSAAVLTHDFAQAVFKMKGLVELLQADNEGLIQKRAQAMEYVRSTVRATLLDSDEEFERKSTPVTGLPELLDRMANRLAAAIKMPVTKLMGQAPAGLNATGQADRDWYNEEVASMQEETAIPALERITEVELHATEGVTKGDVPEGWSIVMPPLEEPTEKEVAENRLKDAQADALWIDRGVLHPEEVATSRFSGDEYGTHIKLNDEVRSAALEMQEQQQERDAELHDQTVASTSAGIEQTKVKTKMAAKKPPPKR